MMKCYQQGARGANARVVQPEMFSRCVQPSQFNSPRIPQFPSAYLLIEGNVRSERTFCGDMCSARPLVVARLLARVPCPSLTSVVCLLVYRDTHLSCIDACAGWIATGSADGSIDVWNACAPRAAEAEAEAAAAAAAAVEAAEAPEPAPEAYRA